MLAKCLPVRFSSLEFSVSNSAAAPRHILDEVVGTVFSQRQLLGAAGLEHCDGGSASVLLPGTNADWMLWWGGAPNLLVALLTALYVQQPQSLPFENPSWIPAFLIVSQTLNHQTPRTPLTAHESLRHKPKIDLERLSRLFAVRITGLEVPNMALLHLVSTAQLLPVCSHLRLCLHTFPVVRFCQLI